MRLRLVSVFFALVVLLSMPFGAASSVSRIISDTNPNPSETVTVSYTVVMDQGEDYYVLNDRVPAGWVLTDNGGGSLGADGIWRLTINPAVTNPSVAGYDLEVPAGASGGYTLSGSYGTVTGASTDSGSIGGSASLTVAGSGTVVSLVPSVTSVTVGNTFSVDVYVTNPVNLYGVQFDLTFDDSVLDLVNIVRDTEVLGTNIGSGSVTGSDVFDPFDGDTVYYAPDSGLVDDFSVLRSGVVSGVTGVNGRVATLTFDTPGSSGSVNLALANVRLVNSDGGTLAHSSSGTSVEVGFCGDTIVQAGLGETCDDGNTIDGDGCSSVCTTLTCATQGGDVCSGENICTGNAVASADSAACCDVACSPPAWTSCGECGTGLFNICDRNECEVLTSPESCFFTDGIVGGTCSACSGASSCSDYTDDSVSCGADICGFAPPSCSFNVGGNVCEAATTEVDCTDGIDNDNNGATDCADSACAGIEGPNAGVLCCGDVSDCANGECTIESCVANECAEVVRSAGDFTECGECHACDSPGGSCAPVALADEGSSCTGECSYCVSGACTIRPAHDFAECSGECEACDGVGVTCVPDTHTQGVMCADPGKYCSSGNCCNDVNGDDVCDSCTLDQECSSPYACAVGVCSAGSCSVDITGCDCGSADTNQDGSWNVNDLSFIILNPLDPRSDVAGGPDPDGSGPLTTSPDGDVDIADLVYVATRIGICSP